MPRLLSRLPAVLSGCLAFAGISTAWAASPLDAYAWEARPLLIFASSDSAPTLRRQLEVLRPHQDELLEREVPVIVVTEDAVRMNGQDAPMSAAALRSRYRISADEFAILLIGKDTGVKLWERETVRPSRIFDLIDSMPMRQQEMRRRSN